MSREFRDALFIFTIYNPYQKRHLKSKWLKSNLKPPPPTPLIFTVVNSLIRVIVQIIATLYLSARVYFSIIIKSLEVGISHKSRKTGYYVKLHFEGLTRLDKKQSLTKNIYPPPLSIWCIQIANISTKTYL